MKRVACLEAIALGTAVLAITLAAVRITEVFNIVVEPPQAQALLLLRPEGKEGPEAVVLGTRIVMPAERIEQLKQIKTDLGEVGLETGKRLRCWGEKSARALTGVLRQEMARIGR